MRNADDTQLPGIPGSFGPGGAPPAGAASARPAPSPFADALWGLLTVGSLAAALVTLVAWDDRRAPLLAGMLVTSFAMAGLVGLAGPRLVRRNWANRLPVPGTVTRMETTGSGDSRRTVAHVRFTPPGGFEREGVASTTGSRGLSAGASVVLQYDPELPEALTTQTCDNAVKMVYATAAAIAIASVPITAVVMLAVNL